MSNNEITTIQVRIDPEVKMKTEKVLKDLGINMTTAINMFCRQIVIQERIPFDIVANKKQG